MLCVVSTGKDDLAPTDESERGKDCWLLLPPVAPWEPNVAAKKNNHSLIDIEHFLPICQISKQSANFVRFCESVWPAVLTMMRWADRLFIWLISCMSQILSHISYHHQLHHILSLQCIDEREIFCNHKQMNWSWKGSDDRSAVFSVGFQHL